MGRISRPSQSVLYLASTSPRRHSLLKAAGINFVAIAPGPEPLGVGTPVELARRRARAKAEVDRTPARAGPEAALILAVDTVVDFDGREFGKPASRADAAAMLRALSGCEHSVHTALCLRRALDQGSPMAEWEDLVSARVHCEPLSEEQLEAYLDSEDWLDKAGGYGIQGEAGQFMHLCSGEIDTVIGLPIGALTALLAAAGYDCTQEGACKQG